MQVFGDDEKVYGWSDIPGFQINIWLSQSNFSSFLEVFIPTPPPPLRAWTPHSTPPLTLRLCALQPTALSATAQILPEGRRRPEGATDVADALHKWFPGGGLQRQREVFQVAAAEPLELPQLGSAVIQTPAAGAAINGSRSAISDGGIAVYRHRLSEANSYVKVRLEVAQLIR